MMFQFSHSNRPCTAYLEYNDCQSKNLLIVYNLDFNADLGYKIIFYPTEDNKWKTNHYIKDKYPTTYFNLCERIVNAVGKNELTFVD